MYTNKVIRPQGKPNEATRDVLNLAKRAVCTICGDHGDIEKLAVVYDVKEIEQGKVQFSVCGVCFSCASSLDDNAIITMVLGR